MRTALVVGFILATSASSLCASELLKGSNYDWSGLYVGAQAGTSWGETGNSWRNANAGYPDWLPDGEISYDSSAIGLHLGYLWQSGWLAYGIEGDITWSSLKGDDSQFAGFVNELKMSRFATIRARMGVTTGRALLFATAGLAVGEIEKNDLTLNASSSNDLVGWTVGGGIEYALVDNLRARAEYQYVDFGSVVSGLNYDHRADNVKIHSLRGGLSYGF